MNILKISLGDFNVKSKLKATKLQAKFTKKSGLS